MKKQQLTESFPSIKAVWANLQKSQHKEKILVHLALESQPAGQCLNGIILI